MTLTIKTEENTIVARKENGDLLFKLNPLRTIPTRKKFDLLDENNNELGTIKRATNNFGLFDLPRFYLKLPGHKEITVLKDMKQFQTMYEINGEKLSIDGEVTGQSFTISESKQKIAKIMVNAEDDQSFSFSIQLDNPDKELLVAAITSIIAMIYEEERYMVRRK
ncbi:LURP-one-related/scramblase family protein [Vagococcus silagei]|uniref:Uncharacterized protein n=1 Tax=Vagococcus silagei TaxID=2508885 RepID=A0A4V3TVC3_9ENTE|nr:hypothetical protein [Vagococcus silagei]THB62369.1 hypothetical protein ESZ54_00720 [Vagococcus silagei]